MLMTDIAASLNLIQISKTATDIEITGGYASDLLSDVLANAKAGNLWITNQKHQNCMAVASLLGLAGVIIAGGIQPDENTVEKAQAESVALYTSELSAFDLAGSLYEMGIR